MSAFYHRAADAARAIAPGCVFSASAISVTAICTTISAFPKTGMMISPHFIRFDEMMLELIAEYGGSIMPNTASARKNVIC